MLNPAVGCCGLRAMMYIALSCVSAVVLRSILSSNNKVDDDGGDDDGDGTEHTQLLTDAKKQLKMSKRKDYYKMLGVSKDASDDEIKKAYRKHALQHHPGQQSLSLYCR